MGEMEIKRALAFLANPRSTCHLVANWSQAQKVEFLRGKLSPADLEEALKRSNPKSEDDLAQFFEMENPQSSRPAARPDAVSFRPEPAAKPSGFGIYGLIGAGLLGALTSALFFSSSDPPKKKKKEEPDPNSSATRIETAPVVFEPAEEMKDQIESMKSQQTLLSSTVTDISSKLSELQKQIESPLMPVDPAFDPFSVHRAIANYIAACPLEQRAKILGTLVMWLQKIEMTPQDRALARINVTTPKYKNEVGVITGVEALMTALGFELNGGFWEFQGKLLPLREGLRVLQEEQSRARASVPPVAFNSTKPWLVSEPKSEPPEEKKEAEVKKDEAVDSQSS